MRAMIFEVCRHGQSWDQPCPDCGRRFIVDAKGRVEREPLSSWMGSRRLNRAIGERTWDGKIREQTSIRTDFSRRRVAP